MSDFSITLKTPIEAHGETLSSITMREPTSGDVMDIGHPMFMTQDGANARIVADYKVVGKYVSVLAGIPLSSVRTMHPGDLKKAGDWVSGFLADSEAEI